MFRRTLRKCESGTPYPHIFKPLRIGNITLPNRIMMGSMHTGLEEHKEDPFGKMAHFFGERAKGGCGLIVTGGIAPNFEGKVHPMAGKMTTKAEAEQYKPVTEAVHRHGGRILMQILHSGRYAYSPIAVAPSSIASPIWKFSPMRPIGMPKFWIRRTIRNFAQCAALAKEAGFDGVEIMGSEGYLINEFLVKHTNKRQDDYGGHYENRMRFALEIVEAVRKACGPDFVIMFRLSMLDLIPNGSTPGEAHLLAERVIGAGADVINTGIGWHEARIPTIATSVPRAAFTWVTKKCRDHLRSKGIQTPLVTSNRINVPSVANDVLQRGDADIVSMARPFLADPEFVNKARNGQSKLINVCIGCNQACLDHVFQNKVSSCLVNPIACAETTLTPTIRDARDQKTVFVVGAGPAGIQAAITAADCGHRVVLFEASDKIGGQFHIAKQIPGKEEFYEAIAYWEAALEARAEKVTLKLNTPFSVQEHIVNSPQGVPEAVLIAVGCGPKEADDSVIPGLSSAKNVASYIDIITGRKTAGKSVAIIGAGGIGFDVATKLVHKPGETFEAYAEAWGIDATQSVPGALKTAKKAKPEREIIMLQRKKGKMGKSLGATTGWIHRAVVKNHGVTQTSGATYHEVTADGCLVFSVGDKKDEKKQLIKQVDTIIMCHGQRPKGAELEDAIKQAGVKHVKKIGGCLEVSEVDAKRAIRQAHLAALAL